MRSEINSSAESYVVSKTGTRDIGEIVSSLKSISRRTDINFLKKIITYVMEKLNEAPELQRGNLYHRLDIAISRRLLDLHISKNFIPEFLQYLQDLKLVKKVEVDQNKKWTIVASNQIEKYVQPQNIKQCIEEHTARKRSYNKKWSTKKTSTLSNATDDNFSKVLLEKIATLVNQINDLQTAMVNKDEEIKALKKRLDEIPKFDALAVANELIEKTKMK